MKKIFIICVLFCISLIAYGQKEANNWYFGWYAGMTWETTRNFDAKGMFGTADATLTNMPIQLKSPPTIPIATDEGCFSLSDHKGNLLFFSDGTNVWNKNRAKMTGLGGTMSGHKSSSQSGVMFPYPDHPNQYITVSLGEKNANNVSYSVIDMTQNGDLGDIVSINNQFLGAMGQTGETVTAVRHANKKDFWIIALGRGANTYLNVWIAKGTGVETAAPATTPFLVDGLDTSASNLTSPNGYIKFSPEGNRFACMARWTQSVIIYGDFNNNTGIFSNVKVQRLRGNDGGMLNFGYGLEFSTDGEYLFACNSNKQAGDQTYTELHVYKFSDLQAAPNFLPTVNEVTPYKRFATKGDPVCESDIAKYRFAGMQTGPDKRLYIAGLSRGGSDNNRRGHLWVIDNPNEVDNLKIYFLDSFLGNLNIPYGLPSFSAVWFSADIAGDDFVCVNDQASFTINFSEGEGLSDFSYTEWDFGDGSIKEIDYTPNTQSRIHKYKTPGIYIVAVKFYDSTGTEVTQAEQAITVTVNSCAIPVNPHIRSRF